MAKALKLDLPYLKPYRDRHGKPRCYFRRKGYSSRALPGEPGSPEFLAAYHAAMESAPLDIRSPAAAGSVEAVIGEYMKSAEFVQLAASTRREMTYVLNKLADQHGAKPLHRLETRHILKWRDAVKDKPGAANKMVRTVKQLLSWSVPRGYIARNVAFGIKMMKTGRWRAWTDRELAAFEKRWKRGTLERTGYDMALYTSQRRGDLVKPLWAGIAGRKLTFVQGKTARKIVVRLHANLLATLRAWRPNCPGETIICCEDGSPMSEVYFGHVMAKAIGEAGLPDDCVLHGLRKTTARVLAELGMKSTPITGHMTAAMQAEYERDADQERMGAAAILKWEKETRRTKRKAV